MSLTSSPESRMYLSREQLTADYLADGLTQREIAAKHGLSQKAVWRSMRHFNIQARTATKRDQRGENNHQWKGKTATKIAKHRRIETERGKPKKCESCGTEDARKSYDWANLTGNYDDPNDYKRMCRSCHAKYDEKILNIRRMRQC